LDDRRRDGGTNSTLRTKEQGTHRTLNEHDDKWYQYLNKSIERKMCVLIFSTTSYTPVFLNRRAAARYRALASIIPGRERPEETTKCYKISLVQLITNLNVILYLSTCHTVYISVLILFMIMPQLIINTYVSLMYELKKNWKAVYQ